ILYEGYALYPYRASALKNRHRWTFGTLSPRGRDEGSALSCECLLEERAGAALSARVRFLHLSRPREVDLGPVEVEGLREAPCRQRFSFEGEGDAIEGEVEIAAALL